jgi:hypothetical protein
LLAKREKRVKRRERDRERERESRGALSKLSDRKPLALTLYGLLLLGLL